jgi:hypothetical protein
MNIRTRFNGKKNVVRSFSQFSDQGSLGRKNPQPQSAKAKVQGSQPKQASPSSGFSSSQIRLFSDPLTEFREKKVRELIVQIKGTDPLSKARRASLEQFLETQILFKSAFQFNWDLKDVVSFRPRKWP